MLMTIGLVARWKTARCATRVNPAKALHAE